MGKHQERALFLHESVITVIRLSDLVLLYIILHVMPDPKIIRNIARKEEILYFYPLVKLYLELI